MALVFINFKLFKRKTAVSIRAMFLLIVSSIIVIICLIVLIFALFLCLNVYVKYVNFANYGVSLIAVPVGRILRLKLTH